MTISSSSSVGVIHPTVIFPASFPSNLNGFNRSATWTSEVSGSLHPEAGIVVQITSERTVHHDVDEEKRITPVVCGRSLDSE